MMTQFDKIKFSFYYQLPCGFFEPRPNGDAIRSDISMHLPVLEYYASLCEHVTEFGVRDGYSTVALIGGCKGQVHSYDIEATPLRARLEGVALPSTWHFHLGDTGDPGLSPMEETELLFIDTLHTYNHVSKELRFHGRKAKRYLAFHDTKTCGIWDASGADPKARGILPAIEEFLDRYDGQYKTVYRTDANNGLWILERSY